jgi:hypothetical protein
VAMEAFCLARPRPPQDFLDIAWIPRAGTGTWFIYLFWLLSLDLVVELTAVIRLRLPHISNTEPPRPSPMPFKGSCPLVLIPRYASLPLS